MKQPSRSKHQKMHYKVNNWSAYNQALKQRGSITLWINEKCAEQWYYSGPTQRGAQFEYSNYAIKLVLIIRQVYKLPFRQTEGFIDSLIKIMNLKIKCPNYSVLCRRMNGIAHTIPCSKKISDIVFDGSGLKVFGEGEWKVRQHGTGKRRTWRKIYIGYNPNTKQAELVDLTSNAVHDADAVTRMIEESGIQQIDRFYGDGGFDKWKIYELLDRLGAEAIISPQHNAKIKRHGNLKGKTLARDENIRQIRIKGKKKWKEEIGYHRRSSIENFYFRYKTIVGDHLKSRKFENQKTEVTISCEILNKMIKCGSPISIKVKVKPAA